MTDHTPTLKPCPHCDSRNVKLRHKKGTGPTVLSSNYYREQVECVDCGARSVVCKRPGGAVAKWNRRSNTEFATLRAKLEEAKQTLRNIAEGNLGDAPWQANYHRIKTVAASTLASLEGDKP